MWGTRRSLARSLRSLAFSLIGSELEVTGNVKNLSPMLWTLSQLTALYVNDNQLARLPSEIACLTNLVTLDLSNNKLRNLPSEIGRERSVSWQLHTDHLILGELITLRELNLTNNSIRNLPYEVGKLFRLKSLGNRCSRSERERRSFSLSQDWREILCHRTFSRSIWNPMVYRNYWLISSIIFRRRSMVISNCSLLSLSFFPGKIARRWLFDIPRL